MAQKNKLGDYAFILGVIIAIVAGLAAGAMTEYAGWIALILVVLGIVVGLVNITGQEAMPFLISAVALMVTGSIAYFTVIDTVLPPIGSWIAAIVGNIAVFVAPAAAIVSLAAIFALARS